MNKLIFIALLTSIIGNSNASQLTNLLSKELIPISHRSFNITILENPISVTFTSTNTPDILTGDPNIDWAIKYTQSWVFEEDFESFCSMHTDDSLSILETKREERESIFRQRKSKGISVTLDREFIGYITFQLENSEAIWVLHKFGEIPVGTVIGCEVALRTPDGEMKCSAPLDQAAITGLLRLYSLEQSLSKLENFNEIDFYASSMKEWISHR